MADSKSVSDIGNFAQEYDCALVKMLRLVEGMGEPSFWPGHELFAVHFISLVSADLGEIGWCVWMGGQDDFDSLIFLKARVYQPTPLCCL